MLTHRPTWPNERQEIDRTAWRGDEQIGRVYKDHTGWNWFSAWSGKACGKAESLDDALAKLKAASIKRRS